MVKQRTITPEPSVEINDKDQYDGKPSPITLNHQPESNSVSESFSQSVSVSVPNQAFAIPIPPNGAIKPSRNGIGIGVRMVPNHIVILIDEDA